MVDSIFRKLRIRETPEIRRVRWFEADKTQRRGMIIHIQKKYWFWGPSICTILCSDGVTREMPDGQFWAMKR